MSETPIREGEKERERREKEMGCVEEAERKKERRKELML